MISIIFSTHKDQTYNNTFISHLKETIGIKEYEILMFQNNNEYSLTEVYNKGLSQSKYDIVCCIHNDILLENNWGRELIKEYKINVDYGIIGLAGSNVMPESGVYWEQMQQTMCGNVYHKIGNNPKYLSKFSPKYKELLEVVTIDGLFISFNKNKIKHQFDESIGKFHFYDHGFCIPNHIDGVKIGVTFSFSITHFSAGVPNDEFHQSRGMFLNKYSNHLPLTLKPKLFVDKIDIKIKKQPKVSIIILSKDKNDLLFQCVDSILNETHYDNYEIIIADTGSSDDNISKIIQKYNTNNKIKLVEYNYYNFSKINNDVVKNHISIDTELIIFCNNDIKLLNDSISMMVKTYQETHNAGTIGIRLHYNDNTIQHAGVLCVHDIKNNNVRFGHHELGNYYNHNRGILRNRFGNTAAFMMMSTKCFIKCGMFNENYSECFEDVELNIKSILNGYENIYLGNAVAYHYESQSRKNDPRKQQREHNDMVNLLIPLVQSNLNKLEKYIIKT